ncbi:MAG: glycosyltransferase family 9 protein [Armatimonadetes bacterium]|nr:glycosyltransferase family 9 protein [Armatimonadota bacterium]
MRKFLVVNMNYMGDALLTTPALAALRRAHPDAQIDTVVGAGAAAQVLESNPDLDNIIARTARGSWGRCSQIYRLLREGRYTDAIILPPLPAYAAAAFFARTPARIGQADRGMNRFLTDRRPTRAVHMADAMLDTMPIAPDARPERRRLWVTVGRDEMEAAERLLSEAGVDLSRPLLAVNVGATRPQKRWFAESFAAALDSLGDVPCVLVGSGEHDAAVAAEVLRCVRRARPVSLVGRTNVKQLAAVLSRCDVLLSADSGPMHLATAVGTPTVALFGSTDPAATGPYDGVSRVLYKSLPCAPCGNHPTCGGRFDCMRAITPDEVAFAVRALLRERRPALAAVLPMAVLARPQVRLYDRVGEQHAAPLREPSEAAKTDIRRILIATKFRFIGDTLLAIPIFRAARAQWPHAHIALLTGKNARLLLQNNPYLDEIIEFDPYKKEKGPRAYLRLVRRLRRGHFDLCLALNRSFHSALTPWLGGARVRAGFKSEGRGPLLNRRVDYDREKSEIACYFDVLRAVAPDAPVNPALELWVSDAERQSATARLRAALGEDFSRLRLIGIQPGASLPGKRWPPERFASVADALVDDDAWARLVVVGGPDEAEAARTMLDCCAPETRARAVDFAGAFDLRGSLAVVSRLRLFVGNDTAVMHSAVALGVPTVALFGPTNPRKWGNYGPCHRVLESPDGTMGALEADRVIAAARELWRATTPVEDCGPVKHRV